MATLFFAHGDPCLMPRRSCYRVLLCSMAFALLLTFCFAARLQADENIPVALGSIAGVVSDINGQPVGGVQVSLFTNYSYNSWYEMRRVTTEADGSYRFTALSVGVYRVGVERTPEPYAPRFYPAASYVQQANDIPVTGNQVTDINLTLQPAGRLVVTITATQDLTITYSYVDLRRRIETPSGVQWGYVSYNNLQITNNVYTITGLAADTYRVCASAYGPGFSAYECYDNVYSVEKATDLVLTAGATISNVAIVLGDGANYGQIWGRVAANDATPLAGIHVYAIAVVEEDVAAAAHPRVTDAGSGRQHTLAPLATTDIYYGYTFTQTNALGEYQLPTLMAGKYKLQFTDPDGDYAFEYYNNTLSENAATLFEVNDRQVISNVNIQLDLGGRISGIVTMQGQPVPNGQVLAERKMEDGAWQPMVGTDINPNTGAYTLGGLPAGSYRVSAQAWISDQQFYFQPYGVYGGTTIDEATEIPITTGSTATGINITLNSPSFDGSISGRVTGQGTPLAGAKVELYRGNTCCFPSAPLPFIYGFTDAEGRYTIQGLTDSSFRLGVSDPTGIYATTYYTNEITPDASPFIYVQDGQALTDLNFDLPLGGAISGEVKRRNGEPVTGLTVFVYTGGSQFFYSTILPAVVYTDAAGHYTLRGLHPGDYYVCFSDSNNGYSECYGAPDTPYGIYYSALAVNVTAGQTTANIDLIWGPDLRSYLPFVAQ